MKLQKKFVFTFCINSRLCIKHFVTQENRKKNQYNNMDQYEENLRKENKIEEPPGLGDAIYRWYNQLINQTMHVTTEQIRNKALIFNEKLFGSSQFDPEVWLEKWENKYNVDLSTCGSFPSDSELVTRCNENIMKYIEEMNLSNEQIFNCNVTILNFLSLPVKSLIHQMERDIANFKKNTDRLTILVCSNASGSLKIPLMVIGQYPSPRSSKGEILKSLPVYYKYRKYSLLDSNLFQEWFSDVFVPKVEQFLKSKGLPVKAVLTIDNRFPHPVLDKLHQGDIKTMFLPCDVNPIVQSVTKEVVDNLKKLYRQELTTNIIEANKEEHGLINYLRYVNIKTVIYWLSECWHRISTNNSWSTVWLDDESNTNKLENDILQLVTILRTVDSIVLINQDDVRNWLHKDSVMKIFLSDDEIIRSVQEEEFGDHIDIKPNLQVCDITARDAREAASRLINFFEDQHISQEELMTLHRLRDKAALIMRQNGSNQEIDDGTVSEKFRYCGIKY